MLKVLFRPALTLAMLATACGAMPLRAQEGPRLKLDPSMLTNESGVGDPSGLFDEQEFSGPYTAMRPESPLELPGSERDKFPLSFYLDFGEVKHLSQIAFYDLNGHDELVVSIGEPGSWTPVFTEDGVGFKTWKPTEFFHTTRYLRFTKSQPSGVFGEVLLWEQTSDQQAELAMRDEMLKKAEADKASRPLIDAGAPFGKLRLIQEVIAGEPNDESVQFAESKPGVTTVTHILGEPVRVLEPGEEAGYFAFKLGAYKLLEASKPYLLTIDFPEDTARSFAIGNRGGEFSQGIFTGSAVGDVFFTFTNNNLESLDVPLSGKMQTYRQLFFLSDRTSDISVPRGEGERPNEPEDGFWVVFSIPNATNMLGSAGAAVWRLRLFEIDNIEQYDAQLTLPPDGLPRRHTFVREEMGDGAINSRSAPERAFDDPVQLYRNKARLYRFLGMDTMSKDLLEFGATQGWDTGNSDWFTEHKFPHLWAGIIDAAAAEGLNVLPYYEYAGSKGKLGLGMEQRAEPLKGPGDYTHVAWTEKARADITDPDTLIDFKKVIELTVLRHKDKAHFLGAWLRPRVSQLPIGFADATRERFGREANAGKTPSRADLRDDAQLMQRYYDWWFGKRKDFLIAVRDYLRENGVSDADVLYTTVSGETGPSVWEPGWGNKAAIVTDQPDYWKSLLTGETYETKRVVAWDEAAGNHTQSKLAQRFPRNWGDWEWNHGAPPADPANYSDTAGIYMTYPFNRLYTVSEGAGMDDFNNQGSMAAICFYPLNENTRDKIMGYFVADYERVGPYCMLEEANAVAHGNPRYLGYLSGYSLNTGFPQQVRRFNQNFLALPALPSEVLSDASSEDAVVVRQIQTDSHGTWYAVVNTGLQPLSSIEIKLPTSAVITDAVTGETLPGSGNGRVSLDLDPGELRSLHTR